MICPGCLEELDTDQMRAQVEEPHSEMTVACYKCDQEFEVSLRFNWHFSGDFDAETFLKLRGIQVPSDLRYALSCWIERRVQRRMGFEQIPESWKTNEIFMRAREYAIKAYDTPIQEAK